MNELFMIEFKIRYNVDRLYIKLKLLTIKYSLDSFLSPKHFFIICFHFNFTQLAIQFTQLAIQFNL